MPHKKHLYLNFFGLVVSIALAIWLSHDAAAQSFISHIGTYGYGGALVGGALYVCTFTIGIGVLVLVTLGKTQSPAMVGLVAAVGAMLFDFTIFHLFREDVKQEAHVLTKKFGNKHLLHIVHSKYFSWTLPVVGALLIASPLPDEIGVSLMGLSKLKTYQFLMLSFTLNALGIFALVSGAYLLTR